jgi:hypothetical protein
MCDLKMSSGMLRRAVSQELTDASEVFTASIMKEMKR